MKSWTEPLMGNEFDLAYTGGIREIFEVLPVRVPGLDDGERSGDGFAVQCKSVDMACRVYARLCQVAQNVAGVQDDLRILMYPTMAYPTAASVAKILRCV